MTKFYKYILVIIFIVVGLKIVTWNRGNSPPAGPVLQSQENFDQSKLISGIENTSPENQDIPQISQTPLPIRKAVPLPPKKIIREGELKVPVVKLKEISDNTPLISTAIPFAQGQLMDEKLVAFFDQNDQEIPIAVQVLARWPQDQTIRSLLVQFHLKIEKLYQYVVMKWGTKRQAADLKLKEPVWDFPEGWILLPARWLCDSQVIGEQVPMGQMEFPQYDQNIETFFPAIRDKGWTGDVREDGFYSTAHVFYQLYARSGELKYLLAARRELLHYRENQVIHEGPERGATPVGQDPRYIYVDALADDYLLTGDPRSLEVAGWMADYLKDRFDPRKAFYPKDSNKFWTERNMTFPFLGHLNYYLISQDQEHFKIAEEYMKNLYKTQMEWPSRGGFIHNLYAHDPEEGAREDEYGGSPFMAGLLLEPIIEYHRLTGSDMAADSIFRALDWLIREGLIKGGDSFKYLTADKYLHSEGESDLNLLVAHAFSYGYKISGYQRKDYLEIGNKVFERGVYKGYLEKRKHFNQNFRSSGHFLGYLKDAPRNSAAGQGLLQEPEPESLLSDILYFEGFENSLGKFSSSGETALKIDRQNVYLNGQVLYAQSLFLSSHFTFGIVLEEWDIEQYPWVNFAYRIPPQTPIGLRVQTSFGDWVCLGGTAQYRCDGTPVKGELTLMDDGKWHECQAQVESSVKTILPKIKQLKAIQFSTLGNATVEQEIWIDDFKIRW